MIRAVVRRAATVATRAIWALAIFGAASAGAQPGRAGAEPARRVRSTASAPAPRPVPAPVRATAPRFGVPASDPGGGVRWSAPADSAPAWARGLVLPPPARADSLALWMRASRQPALRDVAAYRLAALRLADRDSAAADSCLALVDIGSLWAWPALNARMGLALAARDTVRAAALLEHADPGRWQDPERAVWLAARVPLEVARRDTAAAIACAVQVVRAYPAAPATFAALARLDALAAARGDSLAIDVVRQAAEVEAAHGDGTAAARRLHHVLPRLAGREPAIVATRIAALLRQGRRFQAAETATHEALALATDSLARAGAVLERARVLRDAGRPDSALAEFEHASRVAADPLTLDAAMWEAGRFAESLGRFDTAREWYARGAAGGGPRAAPAAFRTGLMELALGRPDLADRWFASDTTDGGRFWRGVTRRALGDRASGDSVLRVLAALPGYAFHRAAARDTLGLGGWPGGVAAAGCAPDSACATLTAARELVSIGAGDEASIVLARWLAHDPRAPGDDPTARGVAARLAAARIAYATGRPGQAIALVDAAARAAESAGTDSLRAVAWATWAWAYPPAYESLFVAPADSAVAALEPALLFALADQESRFDPRARSRSDALGLMQLKLATAADVAGWVGDRRPTEETLFDPQRSVRYGTRYLRRLLQRSEGHVAVALSGYNAGPSSLPPWWRDALARGGEALFCELVPNGDYPRKILGFRQAYRELRPTAVR